MLRSSLGVKYALSSLSDGRPIFIADDDADDQNILRGQMKALFGETSIRTFWNGAQLIECLNDLTPAQRPVGSPGTELEFAL